ncbi:MAG: DUF4190 domain-containing protein [Enterocloster asparagiformis]|nr:DUF4190 domain-containing protein [Enterocloster asparagiformis]
MARWVCDEILNQPADFVDFLMEDYLTKNGFKLTERKGEQVWKVGDGYLTMARFLKYSYNNGALHLEAWVGLFRENALKGFVGSLPKKFYRESLEELVRLLHQPIPQDGTGEPVVVQVPDHSGPAIPALVLGIMGIVIGLLIPIVGLILSGIAMSLGQRARNSAQFGMAKTAVILGTVGMVISLLNWIGGIILNIMFF